MDIDELDDKLHNIAATFEADVRSKTPKPDRPSRKDFRPWAQARLFALEATASSEIVAFRREILHESLLELGEVISWIDTVAHEEGVPNKYVTVPLDDSGKPTLPGEAITQGDLSIGPHLVHFLGNDGQLHAKPYRSGGTLHRLAELSEALSRRYGWIPAAATTFVLTDIGPPPLRTRATKNEPWPWHEPRRSITVTAPLWVPPDEVREAFVQLRTEMLRGPKPGPVSEKRARMAVFAAEHNTGITWKKLLVLWNRKHPEYRFDDESRFIRDCRQTYELITGERLDWRNAPTSRREKS